MKRYKVSYGRTCGTHSSKKGWRYARTITVDDYTEILTMWNKTRKWKVEQLASGNDSFEIAIKIKDMETGRGFEDVLI